MGMLVASEIHHVVDRGCTGKVRYPNAGAAGDAMIRLIERAMAGRVENRLDPAHPLSVYSCSHCGSYHFGHRPTVA